MQTSEILSSCHIKHINFSVFIYDINNYFVCVYLGVSRCSLLSAEHPLASHFSS